MIYWVTLATVSGCWFISYHLSGARERPGFNSHRRSGITLKGTIVPIPPPPPTYTYTPPMPSQCFRALAWLRRVEIVDSYHGKWQILRIKFLSQPTESDRRYAERLWLKACETWSASWSHFDRTAYWYFCISFCVFIFLPYLVAYFWI